ncbi:magnesium-translocating P-type ATPase [Culicoidibacter larvae]|uniref:Magnesium-transporting ATPase, P-type 1 n=1 Tax=Culicoidibacter larvae TaxID=2579976 RepID=A0A5R8QFK6_9FIRM|nr:magnesium-translocating P-type ATPase [Culicoidibacter larvae]TLG76540.1 magnesium-translocating P-type ATPase [Culicoidibacter larvae]
MSRKADIENKERQLNQSAMAQLFHAASADSEALLTEYQNSESGFDDARVLAMRQKYGENRLTHQRKVPTIVQFLLAFTDPFTIVLFVLAIISFVSNVLLAPAGQQDPSTVIIILVLIFISGTLRFVQQYRSKKSADSLNEMVKTKIDVMRNGKVTEVPITEIVVGDLVVLSAGDMIPADVRLISVKDLFVSQAPLTGESTPVEKYAATDSNKNDDVLDLSNVAFMGSNVISGSATSLVVNIGDTTMFGAVAQDIAEKPPLTSFDKGINSVSWLLIRLMLVMVPIVFVLNGIHSNDWLNAFLFALSVAVGLTPAMLPTIVTTNLAKGAVMLSKKKVIVKNIDAIQNFGGMDVLCTDKTGTITQDKVVLMHAYDVNGDESDRVLEYGYLNSNFQTGLKNLMDVAIIDYAQEQDKVEQYKEFVKVDEIPFDFTRRRMSVVVKDSQQRILITKGAIEEMLSVCTLVESEGKTVNLTDELRQQILAQVVKYNADGLRVLGLAYKNEPALEDTFSVQDESEMVLLGYLSFLDPPKDSAKTAIASLKQYGVQVKILTGDNDGVTKTVCHEVGLNVDRILLGSDIARMSKEELDKATETVDVFAKLSPTQKVEVVESLRRNKHVVGFMGDGINDAAAIKQADVGISVDTAVDIAKEAAPIILLEKNLMVLKDGVIEGRKTYGNIIKYIKMTLSSNFGNIFSIVIASIFLPFLPMLPIQILVLNLIYDISCTAIPWDNVDVEFLVKPRDWNAKSIKSYMVWLGPTSSIFDITTFIMLFFVLCPLFVGGSYSSINSEQQLLFAAFFHTGWFVESLWTQTLVIHMIRTPKIPFIQSRASLPMFVFTTLGILIGTVLPYTEIGAILKMEPLPAIYYALLVGTILLYIVLVTVVKKLYVKKYKELL